MNNLIYLIAIVVTFFSYGILEKVFRRFFPKLIPHQLWSSVLYYAWGLVLLIIYFTAVPYDLILKMPINNKTGIYSVLGALMILRFLYINNVDCYYPTKDKKLKCFHYGIVLPIFEEVAFRGLILPMTIYLIGDHAIIIIALNAVLFMLFHLNYWSFKKAYLMKYVNFLLTGVVFIYITILTNSIIYAILIHIIIDGGNTLYRNWAVKESVKIAQ